MSSWKKSSTNRISWDWKQASQVLAHGCGHEHGISTLTFVVLQGEHGQEVDDAVSTYVYRKSLLSCACSIVE